MRVSTGFATPSVLNKKPPAHKLNIPYYRKIMKVPLTLLKNEFAALNSETPRIIGDPYISESMAA